MKEKGKLNFIIAMLIFSSIGIFVRALPYESSFIAFVRGIVGFGVILLVMLLKRQRKIMELLFRLTLPYILLSVQNAAGLMFLVARPPLK